MDEVEIKELGKVEHTIRGFELVKFKDYYDHECSLQQSSLALFEQPGTSAIWLGIDDANPQIMKSDALRFGIKVEGEVSGWMPFTIPEEVQLSTRMHLSLEQVRALIPLLQAWVDNGSFAPTPTTEAKL